MENLYTGDILTTKGDTSRFAHCGKLSLNFAIHVFYSNFRITFLSFLSPFERLQFGQSKACSF